MFCNTFALLSMSERGEGRGGDPSLVHNSPNKPAHGARDVSTLLRFVIRVDLDLEAVCCDCIRSRCLGRLGPSTVNSLMADMSLSRTVGSTVPMGSVKKTIKGN